MAWDSTLHREKTVDERISIVYSRFAAGDTADGTKYSLGGLYVHRVVSYVSKRALENLINAANAKNLSEADLFEFDANGNKVGVIYNRLTPKDCGITREHVIPVNETYNYLCNCFRDTNLIADRRRNEQIIRKLFPKLHIAYITTDEDRRLSNYHLQRRMPDGWWTSSNLDPLDRYRCAELGDDIWVKDFLNDDNSPRWTE